MRLRGDPYEIDITWLFLQVGGPFCGCPYDTSPTIWGLYQGLDTWKLSYQLPVGSY